jgi:WD40 repeat protein
VSPDTGEAQFSLEVGNIQQFVMSADGTLLIALMFGEIQFWSIEPQTQTLIWNAEDDNYFWSVALSADNSLVAAATNSGEVIILETQSGAVIKTLRVNEYGNPDESIGELAFSPNGVQLAGASNRQVVLWDIAQGTKIASLVGRNQVIYSPDARLLLTVHSYEVTSGESEQRNDILIYDAETGAQLATLHVSADYSSRNLVFRPDGTAFYSVRVDSPSSGDNAPLEWTLGNGDNEIVDLIPPPDGSTCPGFSSSRSA